MAPYRRLSSSSGYGNIRIPKLRLSLGGCAFKASMKPVITDLRPRAGQIDIIGRKMP
jgi:hypothetical protein